MWQNFASSTYYSESQSAWEMFYQTQSIALHECHERLSLLLFATRDVSGIFGVQSHGAHFVTSAKSPVQKEALWTTLLCLWLQILVKLTQQRKQTLAKSDWWVAESLNLQLTPRKPTRWVWEVWTKVVGEHILISSNMFVVFQEHFVNTLWMLKWVS